MPDPFTSHQPGLSSPGSDIFPITPNDSTDLATDARALLVTTSGTIRVTTKDGQQRDIPSITAPFILPVRVRRVHSTGTTATVLGIV